MCYMGCPYERYPNGYNETCICTKPKNENCYMTEELEYDALDEYPFDEFFE